MPSKNVMMFGKIKLQLPVTLKYATILAQSVYAKGPRFRGNHTLRTFDNDSTRDLIFILSTRSFTRSAAI